MARMPFMTTSVQSVKRLVVLDKEPDQHDQQDEQHIHLGSTDSLWIGAIGLGYGIAARGPQTNPRSDTPHS
jgi:hypothetical protein